MKMPNKIMSRILGGPASCRRVGDKNRTHHCRSSEAGDAESLARKAPHGSLFSKLVGRIGSTKKDSGVPAVSQQRRGPHQPQEATVELWAQPELLEFRREYARPERNLLTPLCQKLIPAASCQATAVSGPSRAGASDSASDRAELPFAQLADWIGRPVAPANDCVDNAGDWCASPCDSPAERSLVSTCVLRLCMTSPESLARDANHSNSCACRKRFYHCSDLHLRHQRQLGGRKRHCHRQSSSRQHRSLWCSHPDIRRGNSSQVIRCAMRSI